ncbi:hypothetical protein [Corallococcus sp. 4LFB]|uniref:hypothetical protein n=1 Tax=Corallococcus sp. 4LFB TaxID=3383249 RepID=UPI0039758E5D
MPSAPSSFRACSPGGRAISTGSTADSGSSGKVLLPTRSTGFAFAPGGVIT